MNATEIIALLTTGITLYSQLVNDLHAGAITPAEAEARIAAHHAALAATRAGEDAQIAAKP